MCVGGEALVGRIYLIVGNEIVGSRKRTRKNEVKALPLPFYFFLRLISVSVCWYVFEISIGLFVI